MIGYINDDDLKQLYSYIRKSYRGLTLTYADLADIREIMNKYGYEIADDLSLKPNTKPINCNCNNYSKISTNGKWVCSNCGRERIFKTQY